MLKKLQNIFFRSLDVFLSQISLLKTCFLHKFPEPNPNDALGGCKLRNFVFWSFFSIVFFTIEVDRIDSLYEIDAKADANVCTLLTVKRFSVLIQFGQNQGTRMISLYWLFPLVWLIQNDCFTYFWARDVHSDENSGFWIVKNSEKGRILGWCWTGYYFIIITGF